MSPHRPKPALEDLQDALSDFFTSIKPLKSGGQAHLYSGRRIKTSKGAALDQKVAIKLYLDPNEDARIEKEVKAAREAKSASLVKVIGTARVTLSDVEYRLVIWEYVEGIDLEGHLQSGPCSPALVAIIGRDICAAIEALWAQRVVHRDISPKNIMIRKGEESAVLIDLGIAKHTAGTVLTAPGLTWGTNGYLSPEQLGGANLTCQSDIFSLGVTLQQGLYGQHPTEGDQAELLRAPRQTSSLCPNAPARLAFLIDRMLHFRPAKRPQLTELITEFTKLVGIL